MRLLIDVYNALGDRLGDGPLLSCLSASVKRSLDGAGSIKLEFPATDSRVLELLKNERRVRIYLEQDSGLRELGRGVIRNVKVNVAENGTTISADGADTLDALSRRSVLLNRSYTNQTITTIANSLVSLVPGWSAVVEPAVATQLQSTRFDGTSVLIALIRVAEEKGLHLREGSEPNTVELGAFGTQTTMVITNVGGITRAHHQNDDVILIEKLSVTQDSEAVANWIVPIGAGEGAAALTLKNSNRTSPYSIGNMTGADGQPIFYLKDDASIVDNDQIEKIVTFKSIGPLANSELGKQLAANALYDAAAAWLARNSQRQFTYSVTGVKARQKFRPGDKIRLVYKGIVYRDNQPVIPLEVDDYFWVLGVTEKVTQNGVSVDLEISNLDKQAQDAAQIVVGALESIDVRNVSVQTFPYWSENTWTDLIQGNLSGAPPNYKEAKFKLELDNAVTDVVSVKMRFKTKPLYSLTLSDVLFGTSQHYYYYSLYESPHYPSDIRLFIDGIDRTVALGGPWNPSAGNLPVDTTLDITDYIKNASGGLYQDHSIVFKPGYKLGEARVTTSYSSILQSVSQGVIEVNLRVLGIAQAIVPT